MSAHTPGPVEMLARLAIQSERYVRDEEYQIAVNAVIGKPVFDAAPALLAALQAVLHDCENLDMVESNEPGRDAGPWLMATNAIAKATGSAP